MSTFRSWTPAVALTHLGNGDLVGRVHEARRIVVYVRHPNNDGNGALLARGPGGAGDLKRDGQTWRVDDTLQWKVLPENGLHTWKTMWLRFSSSRSRGCSSCSFLPFSWKMGWPLGKTKLRAISVSGSPKIGSSGGVVGCPMTAESA